MTERGGNPRSEAVQRRIQEALAILTALDLPRAQLNDRSALTLLALADLSPNRPWSEATNPPRGITPLMQFIDREYGTRYAPNTRETIRRFTMHQFEDAALVVANPDDPLRPPNSPRFVYQIEPNALNLLQAFGSSGWASALTAYLAAAPTLRERYAQARHLARIPIEVAPGEVLSLSAGGQNVLVKRIVDEFAPRFTPGGRIVYVGDAGEKFAYFDQTYLAQLGVEVDAHGKLPDVTVHHRTADWLVLIEAVTSHGPINPKRRIELEEEIFRAAFPGIVYVTAFLDRRRSRPPDSLRRRAVSGTIPATG